MVTGNAHVLFRAEEWSGKVSAGENDLEAMESAKPALSNSPSSSDENFLVGWQLLPNSALYKGFIEEGYFDKM